MSDPGPLADDLFEDNKDRLRDAVSAIGHEQSRKPARWKLGVVVSVATVLLVAAGLEVVLRVTEDRERALAAGMNRLNSRWLALMQADVFEEIDDDVRHYAMRPGADTTVDGWRFRVNEQRARGPAVATPKPPGEKRLLMLGDSFCFGMWSAEDETLVGHLASFANANADPATTWQAVNLGVPGYHSGQQLRAFEQDGLALEPDVVVIYFNGNDIERSGYFYDEELLALRSDHMPLPHGLKRALWSSHLYGWLVRKHYQAYRSIPDAPFDERVPWAHTRQDNQAATRAALERIVELCREHSIGVFFVNQPFLTWSGSARDPAWRGRELSAFAEDVRSDLDVPGIDLLGWLCGYSDGVDRTPAPADFLPDTYVADRAVERAVASARALARAEGRDYDSAPIADQERWLVATGEPLPAEVDFHLTGEGYRMLADLVYPRMRAAGLVP
ncbi:MAG: GDSL-type esterase/lipase family protein [Planctomycetota bacterium]